MPSALVRWALPLAFAIIVIAPALGVAITGRHLAADHHTPLEVAGITLWMLRGATLSVVLLSLTVIVAWVMAPRRRSLGTPEMALLGVHLMFFITNVLLPAIFGAEPGIEKSYFYVLALFVALFLTGADGIDDVVDAVKWSILIFLLMSFVYAGLRPEAALRTYKPELRLPFVPFRFWGLGSSPNSLAPTALTLLLLAIARPFGTRLWQAVGIGAALAGILLAQSQTTWIATLLIVPALVLYRRRLERRGELRLRLPPALGFALWGIALGAAVLAVTYALDWGGDRVRATPGLGGGGGDLMTGRGSIWRVAIDTALAHPVFGYGLYTWGPDFRAAIAMPYAFHAHNQLLQSLSVAGLVGGLGLVVYVVVLVRTSLKTAAATRGLGPALVVMAVIGSISEAPLDMAPPLLGDTMRHALLFGLLVAGYSRRSQSSAGQADEPARRHRAALAVVRDGTRPSGPLIA